MTDNLTLETKQRLIAIQVQAWQEKRFDVEIAHRVHKRLGATAEQLQTLADELTRCERALAILAEERAALDGA